MKACARGSERLNAVGLATLFAMSLLACDGGRTDRARGDGTATAESGPATVVVTVRAGEQSVPGAQAELLAPENTFTARTDAVGRARFTLDARGPAAVRVARDSTVPRPQRVSAPLLLAPGTVELEVDLDDDADGVYYRSDHPMARWGRAIQALDAIRRRHAEPYREWREAGGRGTLVVDWGGTVDAVRHRLEAERHPEVRAALWGALLWAGVLEAEVTPEEADRALTQLHPDAAFWAWRPGAAWRMILNAARTAEGVYATAAQEDGQAQAGRRELAARRAVEYMGRVVEAQGDVVRPELLLGAMQLADAAGDEDRAVAYYERLMAEYQESRAAELAADLAPAESLDVGDPVPHVPLPALDSTGPPITPDQLAGPATLVDFWATWCVPCVAEMPTIHSAYERFQDRGFDVVSVSADAYRRDVRRFREQYPMPWQHAFVGVEAVSDGEIARAYGIDALPFAVLVGPDGRILATGSELRGHRLAATLERVLGE